LALIDRVREQGLVFDGAMGTMLMKAGLASGAAPESWVLERPEEVIKVHEGYVDAGADVLITNSFGGNPIKLKKAGLEEHTDAINQKAAELAKSVAGDRCLVAGNMGPTGELLMPGAGMSDDEIRDCFAAQARALSRGGADLFALQTFFSLKEIQLAVAAIRSFSTLPVLASMTFQDTPKGFVSMMGDGAENSMQALMNSGADIVGANCSLSSAAMIKLAETVRRAVPIPVSITPNAGNPELRDGKTVYSEDAGVFSENMQRIKALGVEVIGGCCGTTPEHIRRTVERIKT